MLTPADLHGGTGLHRARRLDSAPLRVAVLCSHRTPGIERLLDPAGPGRRGFEIVVGMSTEPECRAKDAFVSAGVPLLTHDVRAFHRARSARLADREARAAYDERTLDLLAPHRPDVIVLLAYLYVATPVLLDAYPDRVLNVHDSDLRIRERDGRPRYRGLRSTLDAIAGGETETRSTVHLVTEEVDVGPPVVVSPAFPVHSMTIDARRWGADDVLKAYAYAHREWMMRAAWGPMLERALERVARGDVRLLGGRVVVGGALGPEEMTKGAAPLSAAAAGGPR